MRRQRAVYPGVMHRPMIDSAHLVETLELAFPGIRAELHDETWDGLLHLQVAVFARYTQEQIDAHDVTELRRCFELARQFMLHGDPAVDNAMHVSYLEHLNFSDQRTERAWALKEMPEPLSSGYKLLNSYRGA
jgi:hypothetical protein